MLGTHNFTEIMDLPVVPRKAVAEVSELGHRTGELLQCMDGSATPLMNRKVVRAAFFGAVAVVAVVAAVAAGGHLTNNCWMWCGVVRL